MFKHKYNAMLTASKPGRSFRAQNGFTIVELIIVVAVVGVLAAVVILGYGNWRGNIAKSQLTSDLNGVKSAMDDRRNFSSGYPTSLPTTFTASDGVTLTYVWGDAKGYCIRAQSSVNSVPRFHVSTADGLEPKEGDCPAQPVAPVTISAPSGINASVTGASASVSWNAVSGATSYDVRYNRNGGTWTTSTVSALTTNISGLVASSQYYIEVRAKNASATSNWSATLNRVTVPTPSITSATDLGCGNSGGTQSWINASVTWPASSLTYTTNYRFTGGTSSAYGLVPKTVGNSGSGSLTTTTSSSQWTANASGSGTVYLYGVGPNGELSAPATWTSSVRPPYDC